MMHLIKDCIPVASSETAGDNAKTITEGRRGHGTTSPLRTVIDTDVCLVLTCKTSVSGLLSYKLLKLKVRLSVLPTPSLLLVLEESLTLPPKKKKNHNNLCHSISKYFLDFLCCKNIFSQPTESLRYHQMLLNCEM